jgi:hypothetical protein
LTRGARPEYNLRLLETPPLRFVTYLSPSLPRELFDFSDVIVAAVDESLYASEQAALREAPAPEAALAALA